MSCSKSKALAVKVFFLLNVIMCFNLYALFFNFQMYRTCFIVYFVITLFLCICWYLYGS